MKFAVTTTLAVALAIIPIGQTGADPDYDISGAVRERTLTTEIMEKLKQRNNSLTKEMLSTKDNVPKMAESSVGQASSKVAPPDPYVYALQPYCMGLDDNDGNGYLACFDMERSLCTQAGSQYVIGARYERADPASSVERLGEPFCSDPAEPVVVDPAVDDTAAAAPEAPPMPVVTFEDFRRLDIAPSKIESDSGGFGLIRANTNFYATEEVQTLSTVMLEQQVAIQAIPVQWTFDYGDGTAPLVSSSPGGPQRKFNQQTTTSHAYQDTGTFPVNVSTAYRGQFSVNGGPWIAIPGTASVPSAPVEADIWRSESKNVAEDCDANPDGWACGDPFIER